MATSFAIGVFVATMPTFGLGLVLYLVLAIAVDRISKVSLFASVVVFNPVVNWGVYLLSDVIGVRLLGPVAGVTLSASTLSVGTDVALRVFLGSLVLEVVFTIVGYVVVYRLVRGWRRRELDLEEFILEPFLG